MAQSALSFNEIIQQLDIYFDVEFSYIKSEEPASLIVEQTRHEQDLILDLTRRIAATNAELAFQFACSSVKALQSMDKHMVEAWAMTATDNYDQKGLFPAMTVIRDLDSYIESAKIHACGAVLEEEISVLLPFLHGLSGRKMKIAAASQAYTDTETIFLPAITAVFAQPKDNFLVYKATLAMLWAQVHYGTFRHPFDVLLDNNCADNNQPDDNPSLKLQNFCALETIRLEACLKRDLPGLYRDMQKLNQKTGQAENTAPLTTGNQPQWSSMVARLSSHQASINDTWACFAETDHQSLLSSRHCCYQGILNLADVHQVMQKRIEKEKAFFRVALSELAQEIKKQDDDEVSAEDIDSATPQPKFEALEKNNSLAFESGVIELQLDGELVALPEQTRELMTSIFVDFGEIPPEYLYAAGPGEYELKKYDDEKLNPDDVWKGTYHEEGAELYNEWDFKRQHYHKNWCVLRQLDVKPEYNNFVTDTLQKHKGLLKSLRHSFEILRGEDKLLKKQVHGDDIDIDALVEAYADASSGLEMSDRLFTKMHKQERNVAVIFMVDMSGSTKGWINDAERETLILLAEVLEILDDRYAIYGFSGMTRKRCELYKIKSFTEDYNAEIKARIANIQPQDYTRMGVFIRHATQMFSQVEASTKLMITLSDGKPDDYDTYRGEYGVEDTRQALYEAHRDGIHSFCITIDEQARDYLPHMYGAANYAVIDDVAQLPQKVSDIYRRLTS